MKEAVGPRSLIFLDGGEWENMEWAMERKLKLLETKHDVLRQKDEELPNKQELSHQTNEEAI